MATNFNDTTPEAPAGRLNVAWQFDGEGNASASAEAPYCPTGFIPGTFDDAQELLRIPIGGGDVFFPADFDGSLATLEVAPADGSAIFDIINNGYPIGEITFAMGSQTGVFTTTGGTAKVLHAGDILEIVAPATHDSVAAGLGFYLAGARN